MPDDGASTDEPLAQPALIGYGEAMDRLRADPKYNDLIRDIYLGPDPARGGPAVRGVGGVAGDATDPR